MAGRESAGAIYITIDGDASPLLEKYQQAEAQSRAAGQRIAAGLGQGLGQASGIVDQFGRAVSSGIVAPMEEAAPAVDNATRSVRGLSQALHGTVPEVAAASGAIRVLEGNMPIRAVERFATNVLGLGPILQGAFPLVGAIALGEMVVHVAENFGKLSEEEKKTAEDTKRVSDEWESLAKQLEGGEVEKATLEIGRLAGLRIGSFFDESEAQRMRARLAALTEQATAARRAMAIDTGTASLSSNPLVAGAQAINPAVTINRYLANVDFKDQAAKAKTLDDEIGILTEKLKIYDQTTSKINADKQQKETADEAKKAAEESKRVLDERRTAFKDFYDNQLADLKAAHEVSHAEELRFRQEELADSRIGGLGGADGNPVLREVKNQVGTLSQDVDRDNTAEAKKQAEAQKKIREDAIRDLAEDGRLMDEQVRANATSAREAESEAESEATRQSGIQQRTGQLGIQKQGVSAESDNETAKLREQQTYAAQITHSRQDQVIEAQKLAGFDEKALQIKISIAQLETIGAILEQSRVPTKEGELKIAEDELKIEQAKAALLKQQIEDETKIAELIDSQNLGRQLATDLYKGLTVQLPANLGNALASGITGGGKKGEDVGKQVGDALKQTGKQILGEAFTQIIQRLIAEVVVQTGLQAAFNALFPAVVTPQIAATTANTAAIVALTAATTASAVASTGSAAVGVGGAAAGVAASVASAAASGAASAIAPIIGGLISAAGAVTGGVISGTMSAAATFVGDSGIIKAINATTAAVLSLRATGIGGTSSASSAGSSTAPAAPTQSFLGNLGSSAFSALTASGALPVELMAINPAIGIASLVHVFGFATGGRPAPGVPYIVGENGPELRIDDGPGVIIPNHVAFGGNVSSPLMTSSMVSNSASSAFSVGAIHLHGVRNIEDFARRLPDVLKSRAPNFSPATS